jgi:capsular polysaccharide biosynthesis protein
VARRLKGTWLYAGNWSTHFGHFLLETLTNLWPDPGQHAASLTGILAHRPIGGKLPSSGRPVPLRAPNLKPWQGELLALTGYGAAEKRIVHGRPLKVERLLVPARPVLLKRWALPPAVDVWRRVSERVGRRGPHDRIFLSRSRFHGRRADRARTDAAWDAGVDALFGAAGFHVVHPETIPVSEQIALVRGAAVLAGPAGSALHLSVFADPGARVLVIGDRRSPHRPPPTQTVIDAACGHQTAFAPNRDEAALAAILAGLDEG